MRTCIKHNFPAIAPLVTAGIVRVDDPNMNVAEPVRATERPHARGFVISQKMAGMLMAMSAKREAAEKKASETE